jgi:hypothetical protein
MPESRDLPVSNTEAVSRGPKNAESESSPSNSGHLIRGVVDYEDVLDRLSKGVSVPSDLTHKGKSTDNS